MFKAVIIQRSKLTNNSVYQCVGVYRCVPVRISVCQCVPVRVGVYRCVLVRVSACRCLSVCVSACQCVSVSGLVNKKTIKRENDRRTKNRTYEEGWNISKSLRTDLLILATTTFFEGSTYWSIWKGFCVDLRPGCKAPSFRSRFSGRVEAVQWLKCHTNPTV